MGLFDFLKKKPTIPPEALMLWVHRRSHFEHLGELARARGAAAFNAIPFSEVFAATPALLTEEGFVALSEAHLEGLGMDVSAAFQRATQNALPLVQKMGISDGLCIWEGPGRESAVVAGALVRKHAPIKGDLVMMIPAEGLVLAAGTDDPAALERMLDLAERAYRESSEFRSLRPVVFEAGPMPQAWLPPADHPLSTRFRTAAARTYRHEAEAEHQVFAKDQAPLAHLAVLDSHGGGLAAAWMRDADIVVPNELNRLVLLDTPDQPLPRVDLDFGVFLDVFPHAVEPLTRSDEDDAERLYRLRGALFPTAHERRFLLQRDALAQQSPEQESREVPGQELLTEWDSGATMLAGAAETPGDVLLQAPDGRLGVVTAAQFGARVEKLPVEDQHRYYQSFAVGAMARLMSALMAGGDEEGDEDAPAPDPGEVPEMPEGLGERAYGARPRLLSSNELRAVKEELAKETDEVTRMVALSRVEAWEPSQLFPVVRPPGYEGGSKANMAGMAQGMAGDDVKIVGEPEPVSRPGPRGLRLDLVSDRGDRMMVVDGTSLGPERTEAAWRTALLNLEAASLQPLEREAEGRYGGPWHDDYDFGRLLLVPRLLNSCKVKGAPLVFAPTVGRTWVTGADDVEAQRAVLDAIDAFLASGKATTPYQYRQLLFGSPWTPVDGALVKWEVPAGHPLAARMEALDETLERRRASSRAHVGEFAKAAARPGVAPPESQA